MGFAFLPVAIGSFAAGPISDWLRINYIENNPQLMWQIVGAIGLVCTVLMLAYDQLIVKRISK
jgi:proton-dependent oligopeptide transporter, POT family